MYRLRGKGIKNKDWFAGHLNHHSIICCMGGMSFISNWQNGALIYSCMDMSQFILQRTSRVQTLCIVTAYVKFLPFWIFFLIKFFKEYLKFYTPQKLWIFFPNRCISYLSISRFYSRKWYFPLCKSRSIN